MASKILHIDSNHPIISQQLAEAGFENHEDFSSTKTEIQNKMPDYEGVVIRSRFKIDKEFIDASPNLKFIARVGAGLESIDCEYATSKNIALIAAPEGNRNAVGEHALGMLLSLFNKLNLADREIRSGQWNRESNRGVELDGKTVGIIGYGNMGKSFAKKLRGFDVEVLCYDIAPNVADANAKQVSLEELQSKADVLSLHIPWTPETDKMVNAEFIAAFEKPFWLINTSRGKNVVTKDLVSAIESGKILGAGLDVLEYEKLSFESLFSGDSIPEAFEYLLKSDKVLLSPHIAGWTVESKIGLAQVIVDKIKALYFGASTSKEKAAVSGIGGFFFKAKNPSELYDWYKTHLGIPASNYGWSFNWQDKNGNEGLTNWSIFKQETTYLNPSEKEFMQNFIVTDLDQLLEQLRQDNITLIGEPETHEYGKFAWILDPEGNKIELWQPTGKL